MPHYIHPSTHTHTHTPYKYTSTGKTALKTLLHDYLFSLPRLRYFFCAVLLQVNRQLHMWMCKHLFKNYLYFIYFLATTHDTWDLPQPQMEPRLKQSLDHWTTREIQKGVSLPRQATAMDEFQPKQKYWWMEVEAGGRSGVHCLC